MDLGLTDRVFVVTAASSGLGFATAEQLVAEGARVVLVARREELLAERRAQLGEDRAVTLTADLAEPGVPEQACRLALDTFGRLDGAMISVGGPPGGKSLENSDDQWRAAFESVFLAAIRTIDAVVELGTADDLAIGLVLSTSVKVWLPGLTISNGLRPGLANLVSQYAAELGPRGVRLFGLMPGSIATERLQWSMEQADDPDRQRQQTAARIPLGRIGDPAEFGRVACFLLSPAAGYVSGTTIPVDGGVLATP
ncbi:3-oxoacyl-[acyl-carrier protein] reductase [Propionibacteriaceae bacterium ES.041]|uniref:Oxidoreductase n=1 Tax=Enemella evansiae TaxID=2016499 RepID=A0A255GFG3_9ACTN|nr:SDR family oxidoreductase [Enemella evansiae]PFG67781.1 3-oxoacyl-[acyl-carrier protein] reductase [Propionibacteriaceae bacterium ES.041]OYN94704.1 oxidoreductase [Enemella evansiae]OYO07025.1 oxidoreductase [Enemella evansiae]OYO08452.1 oxidoreductase [Enemella evansiae]OYO14590.1 oxidoreductase [Enemella evansiae]